MVASKGKVKRSTETAEAESGKKKKTTTTKKAAAAKTKPEKPVVADDAELGDEGVEAQAAMEVDTAAPKKAGKKGRKEVDALAAGADKVPLAGGAKGGKSAPAAPAAESAGRAKKAAQREKSEEEQNVVYVGHLPPGFEERALRSFFEQFGTVKAVVLGRSQRTGGSQHFGFVEFERADVAHIAAAAMNGYFMEGRRLDVAMADGSVGDLEERLPARAVVKRGNKIIARHDTRPWHAPSRHAQRVNEALEARVAEAQTEEGRKGLARRLRRAQKRRAAKLTSAGIEGYTVPEPKQVVL